jgi:hypothetical protein
MKFSAEIERILARNLAEMKRKTAAILMPPSRFNGVLEISAHCVGQTVVADLRTDNGGLIHLRAVDAVGDQLLLFGKGQRIRVAGKREGARGLLLEKVRQAAQ